MLFLAGPLISPTHMQIYHLTGPASAAWVPVLFYVCLLWFFLAILFRFAAKPGRVHYFVWLGFILFLPWILLVNCASVIDRDIPLWLSLLVFLLPSILFLGAWRAWHASFRDIFIPVQQFTARMLGYASLAGVVIFGQLLWLGWQTRALNSPAPLHHSLHRQQLASDEAAPRTRVIWILLDELSYQQVYERRFPGLQLPEFDRFAAESTVFTHVVPAGIYTQIVLPSLMTGLPADRIRVSADGQLRALHDPENGAWNAFTPRQTVFQDALDRGYSTGIAGWYNPYCRILPEVLDQCFWVLRTPISGGMDSNQSLTANLLGPVRSLFSYLRFSLLGVFDPSSRRTPIPADSYTQMHIDDYRDLYAAADKLLANATVDFIFLHIPAPHPPGIYDRRLMKLTASHSSYLDNLVLADQYLAHVRLVLEQQGQWDSSAVVAMGDHSWRTTLLWSNSPNWTKEEGAASEGGQFDDRPGYIVKLPQQHAPARIDTPFAAVHTRALLDAILNNRLHTASELQTWVRQQEEAK
jgi:Sulfatase